LISGQVIWVDIGDDRAREKTCQALREGAPEIRKKTRAHSRPVRHKSKYANTTSGASLASSSFEDENADDDEDYLEDEVDPTTEAVGDGVGSRKPNSSSDDDAAMALSPNPSGNFRKRVEGYERYDSDGRRVGDIAMQSRGMSRHHASGEVAGGGGGDVGDSRDDTDMDRKPSSLPSSPGGDTIWIRPWHRLLPDRSIVTPIAVDQLSKEDREMYLHDFLPPNPQEEYRSSQKQPPPSGPRNHPTTIVPSAESRSPEGRHEVEKQSSSPPLQSDSHADGGRMSA
jgi:hypothetical protein